MPRGGLFGVANVEHGRASQVAGGGEGRACAHERPAVERDDHVHVRRPRRVLRERVRDEVVDRVDAQRGVRAALVPDRRRGVRAHRGAAERPRDVARVHRDVVRELLEPSQAVEQALGALRGPDREVRPRGVADEERVTGEQHSLVDEQRAVLGTVPRRVQHAHDDLADAPARRRRRSDRTRTPARRADGSRHATPCSSASRPCPATWSAWLWVSTARTMRSPCRSASSMYCSIANAGSTTIASPACSEPIR